MQSESPEAQPAQREQWQQGSGYDAFMGRWSRLLARAALPRLGVPPGRRWLDVGCGTGAFSQAVLAWAAPSAVTGVDPSAPFIAFAQAALPDRRVHFVVGEAQQLPVESAAFDVTVAGLVLNFVPDAARAVAEMARATCPGGLVAAYVWDYAAGMQVLRCFWDAATALDPAAACLGEGRRFPLCQPQALADLFRAGSLLDVAVGPLEIATTCRDFDDYWTPFLSGQGPAPSYVAALEAHGRARLHERLRASVPAQADGTIALMARAWVVCGRRG